ERADGSIRVSDAFGGLPAGAAASGRRRRPAHAVGRPDLAALRVRTARPRALTTFRGLPGPFQAGRPGRWVARREGLFACLVDPVLVAEHGPVCRLVRGGAFPSHHYLF